MAFVARTSAAYRYGERAAEIRQRLTRPLNAVKDEGIDLRRHRKEKPKPRKVLIEPQPAIRALPEVKPQFLPRIPIIEVRNHICQFYGVPVDKLLADCRKPVIALCRHVAVYMVRVKLKKSWGEMMPAFAYRDHTTLLHSYKVIKQRIEGGDAELGRQIDEMWNAILAVKGRLADAAQPEPAVAHEYKNQADLFESGLLRLEETSTPPLAGPETQGLQDPTG